MLILLGARGLWARIENKATNRSRKSRCAETNAQVRQSKSPSAPHSFRSVVQEKVVNRGGRCPHSTSTFPRAARF